MILATIIIAITLSIILKAGLPGAEQSPGQRVDGRGADAGCPVLRVYIIMYITIVFYNYNFL